VAGTPARYVDCWSRLYLTLFNVVITVFMNTGHQHNPSCSREVWWVLVEVWPGEGAAAAHPQRWRTPIAKHAAGGVNAELTLLDINHVCTFDRC
jgi:hypothetical protein